VGVPAEGKCALRASTAGEKKKEKKIVPKVFILREISQWGSF
jgi:hypothetical protein